MATDGLGLPRTWTYYTEGQPFNNMLGNGGLKNPEADFSKIIGYESVTRKPMGDVINNMNTQLGLRSFDPTFVDAQEPIRMGKFIVKTLKIPAFFDPVMARLMKFVFEDNVKQISGIPENQLDTISQTNGANRTESDFPGSYKQSGKDLSLTTIEYAGGVVRKLINYWIYGISDRDTTIAHMYGKNLPFVRSSYSASFLYVMLGPTARPTDIEFNCAFHECWPTKEVGGYLSSNTLGDAGSVSDVEVNFTGMYQNCNELDILGQLITASYGLYSESALGQTLPAYIYATYFGKMFASGSDSWEKYYQYVSVRQKERMAVQALSNNSPYNKNVQATRDQVLGLIYGDPSLASAIDSNYDPYKAFNEIVARN